MDSTGNVYLGGYFATSNLTTPVLSKIGNQDAFALKLDSSGNTTWAKNFGGSGAGAGRRFDLQPVVASDEFDAESALGVSEVFLAARVESAEVSGTREVEGAGGHGWKMTND